jgi:cytochrome b561
MSNTTEAGIQPPALTILGWVLAVSFAALFYNIVEMPRTALELREPLRQFHFSLGLVVSVLALWRLIWWFTGPKLTGPEGLPPASFAFHRSILFALLVVFVVETVIGFIYAWGIGDAVSLFGIHLPAFLAKSEALRMAYGYFHSSLGFYYMMLLSIWLAYGVYQHWRYKSGLKRLFPGASV